MQLSHVFDLEITESSNSLELFAEELSAQEQLWDDCASTASSGSTSWTAFTVGTMGSVVSCGDDTIVWGS